MRDQLKRLEELQRFDAQIQELSNALKAIPAKLQASQNDLARVEGLLETERTQLTETQRYYSEQKTQLSTEEATVSGAKHKLSLAKNSKEYVAAQREIEQTRESDIATFVKIAGGKGYDTPKDVPLTILAPAFMTSELKTAFQIGFLLFIPFVIIDLVVASVLMSMGMMMLSPVLISLPFKIMLFVLVDGWALLMGSLAASFYR